jgi:hypothetical protein
VAKKFPESKPEVSVNGKAQSEMTRRCGAWFTGAESEVVDAKGK